MLQCVGQRTRMLINTFAGELPLSPCAESRISRVDRFTQQLMCSAQYRRWRLWCVDQHTAVQIYSSRRGFYSLLTSATCLRQHNNAYAHSGILAVALSILAGLFKPWSTKHLVTTNQWRVRATLNNIGQRFILIVDKYSCQVLHAMGPIDIARMFLHNMLHFHRSTKLRRMHIDPESQPSFLRP